MWSLTLQGGSDVSFTLMGMHREPKRSQGSRPEVETRTFTCKRSPAAPSNNTNIGMLKCCWEFPQASQRGRALWGKAAGNARWEGKIPALDSSFHPSLRGLRSPPSPGSCAHSSCAHSSCVTVPPTPNCTECVPSRGLKPMEDLILIHFMSVFCLATDRKALGTNHCHPLDHHSLNFHPLEAKRYRDIGDFRVSFHCWSLQERCLSLGNKSAAAGGVWRQWLFQLLYGPVKP